MASEVKYDATSFGSWALTAARHWSATVRTMSVGDM
jgi:hypothetical protein